MKILVKFDDGDFTVTSINSTLEEAEKYYLGNTFVKSNETCHIAIEVYKIHADIDIPYIYYSYLKNGKELYNIAMNYKDNSEIVNRMNTFYGYDSQFILCALKAIKNYFED